MRCAEMWSPVPRVWHSIRHVRHLKLRVLVSLHIKTLEQISGIVSFPSVQHPQVEKKIWRFQKLLRRRLAQTHPPRWPPPWIYLISALRDYSTDTPGHSRLYIVSWSQILIHADKDFT